MGLSCYKNCMGENDNNNTLEFKKRISHNTPHTQLQVFEINEIFETNYDNPEKSNNKLLTIIQDLKKKNEDQINIITIIELFNKILYLNNNNNNDYLVFDMRPSEEQKENYIKKIKPINITVNEILNISNEVISKLQPLIYNNKIIIYLEMKILMTTLKLYASRF